MAASREEVYERVKEVLTEQLGVDEGEITEEASFQEDLDADSLDLVELIMELEDQFGIKISGRGRPEDHRPSGRLSTTSPRTSRPTGGSTALDRSTLPAGARSSTSSRTPPGRPIARRRTSGSSSSATACSSSRSPARSTTRYPDFSRGRLAKIRSHVVSRASCAVVARSSISGRGCWSAGRRPDPEEELAAARSKNRNVLAALLQASLARSSSSTASQKIEPAVVDAFADRIEYALHEPRRLQDRASGGARPAGRRRSAMSVLNVEGAPHDRHLHLCGKHRRRPGRSRAETLRRPRSERRLNRCSLSSASPSPRRRSALDWTPPAE